MCLSWLLHVTVTDCDTSSMSETLETDPNFCREHPADEVYVTGTFDNWTKSVQLEKKGDVFSKTVDLKEPQSQQLPPIFPISTFTLHWSWLKTTRHWPAIVASAEVEIFLSSSKSYSDGGRKHCYQPQRLCDCCCSTKLDV
jgi:hypothetical protein